MTIKKKHKLMIMMMTTQSNTTSYILHKKKKLIFCLFFALLAHTLLLKRISIIVVRVKRKREERLAAIARPSINDYTRLIIICISSSPPSFIFTRYLSLSPLLRTLIVLHQWIIYTLTIIWQWLCAWPQCEREHIYIYISWKTRSKGEST